MHFIQKLKENCSRRLITLLCFLILRLESYWISRGWLFCQSQSCYSHPLIALSKLCLWEDNVTDISQLWRYISNGSTLHSPVLVRGSFVLTFLMFPCLILTSAITEMHEHRAKIQDSCILKLQPPHDTVIYIRNIKHTMMLLVFPVLVTKDCNTPHLNCIKFPKNMP